MRVVLDTNVLIAAFVSPEGFASQILDLWIEGDYYLVTSTWQIEEFKRVSRYDRLTLPRLKRVGFLDYACVHNHYVSVQRF
ncbi:MAG: PIN domain-containing protein [Trueperaceae bacterium]